MITSTVLIHVHYKYCHPVYGDIFDVYTEKGNHEANYACTKTQVLEFISKAKHLYKKGQWFTVSPVGEMTPVRKIIKIQYHI